MQSGAHFNFLHDRQLSIIILLQHFVFCNPIEILILCVIAMKGVTVVSPTGFNVNFKQYMPIMLQINCTLLRLSHINEVVMQLI